MGLRRQPKCQVDADTAVLRWKHTHRTLFGVDMSVSQSELPVRFSAKDECPLLALPNRHQ